MSLTQATINWDASAYVEEVRRALNEVIEYGAKMTEEDAKRNLERMAPGSTGTLASEIDIKKSNFEDGGWIVEAQGAGNYKVVTTKKGTTRRRYYASFVELGTSKMQGLGYMRKALRRNKYRMRAKLKQQFGEVR